MPFSGYAVSETSKLSSGAVTFARDHTPSSRPMDALNDENMRIRGTPANGAMTMSKLSTSSNTWPILVIVPPK